MPGTGPKTRGLIRDERRVRLLDEIDRDAARDHRRQPLRVPVGQAQAAMRGGFADLRRLGRAVNAVARPRQRDPDDAERTVRAGLQQKGLSRLDLAELVSWVVAIRRLIITVQDVRAARDVN